MLMQGAILEIFLAARLELREAGDANVHLQVMEGQNFGQMGQVVLTHAALEVLEHVGEGRDGSRVIEGSLFVRQDQE
jgi:hypothetical protein